MSTLEIALIVAAALVVILFSAGVIYLIGISIHYGPRLYGNDRP